MAVQMREIGRGERTPVDTCFVARDVDYEGLRTNMNEVRSEILNGKEGMVGG